MKRLMRILIIMAVAGLAIGSPMTKAEGKTFISIATSTSGGTFYAVGGKLADMMSKHIPDVQATAEVTAGGVENARQIKNKKIQIALMPGDTLYNAVNGINEFKTGKIPITQIAALYPTPLQVVALEKSGIKTFADLKGKKVSMGAPGSGTAIRAEIVLKAHGLTLNDIKMDKTTSSESATQLMDRQIHAAFYASGAPMAAIMDIAAKDKIVMLSITPEAIAKIEKEHPDLFKMLLKEGTYPNMSQSATCVGNMSILVSSPDASTDLIYQVTKMIFERRDDFVTAHKSLARDFALEQALSQQPLAPFHPGALKYYREKGIIK